MADQHDDSASQKPPSEEEALRYLLEGGFRKSLGLTRDEWRLGLDLAKSQLQRGRHGEALHTYATLVLCDPSDTELQIGFSNCALLVGENSLALQAASAAIMLTPDDCRGYFLSGKACLALGLRTESREDFERALALSNGGAGPADAAVSLGARKYLAMIEATE